MTHDLIIIGAGIAGLTASIYASRYKINHLVFGSVPGGQGIMAGKVENYPGWTSISGANLMKKVLSQTERHGIKIIQEPILGLAKTGKIFEAVSKSRRYKARTLILAMGASPRTLGVQGEKELLGRGVSYCVTCDIPLFRNKIIAIVGGGDSAISGAIHASAFAQKIYLVHRRRDFRAEPEWVRRMEQKRKIEKVLATQVTQIIGKNKVEAIMIDKPYQGEKILKIDGVFIEIGQIPSSSLASPLGVKLDEQGYIKVNPQMATNIPGIFSAGDVAAIEGGVLLRQFITSAADGARAAASAYKFLCSLSPTRFRPPTNRW